MWEKIYSTFRLIFNFANELRQIQETQENATRELKEQSDLIRRVVFEMERLRENEAHEREKLELRLKIEMLQRQLPERQDKPEA